MAERFTGRDLPAPTFDRLQDVQMVLQVVQRAVIRELLEQIQDSLLGVHCQELLFALENSRTCSACSRVTVGKFSRNSSSVRPASKLLISASTGTRVPRNTGAPLRTSGSILTGSSLSSFSPITSVIVRTFGLSLPRIIVEAGVEVYRSTWGPVPFRLGSVPVFDPM